MERHEIAHPSILLIGSGRLARHLQHYFTLLNIKIESWSRSDGLVNLPAKLKSRTHVLVAISDSALEAFIRENLTSFDGVIVHFSGALEIPGAIAAHPLMSFGQSLYNLADYEKIHFVLTGSIDLKTAMPGLKNPFSILPADKKALYHALCVLGGNFPTILWSKMADGLRRLDIPESAIDPYLEKCLQNFLRSGPKALTGPLVRKDLKTIRKNIDALKDDPFQKIYESFVEVYS